MNRSAIDTVVFDLGGVLVDWNPRYLYRQLFDDEAAMEHFLTHVCSGPWNEQQDAGRPWHEAVATLSREHPQHAPLIEAYWHRWEETLGDALDETVELLAALKHRGVRLYALTNWSGETFPVARRRFDFLKWFEGIVVSGDERLIKPDPAIFKRLLERYSIEPTRALYIDDARRNVDAAEKLGMHAFWFRDADALREHLISLQLIERDEASHG
jgi:2-haloacid dehalogenase